MGIFLNNEEWFNIVKDDVLNNLLKMIGVHLHKEKIMNQLHILVSLFNLFYL
jgi:hypothetical protein